MLRPYPLREIRYWELRKWIGNPKNILYRQSIGQLTDWSISPMLVPMLCPYLSPSMPYNPNIHHRRSIRLKGYDYASPGAYFITICTRDRVCYFGNVVKGEMRLNQLGECVRSVWQNLPHHFSDLTLDEFVVMPNHMHGILVLNGTCRGEAFANQGSDQSHPVDANASPLLPPHGTKPGSIAAIVQNFKSVSTRKINQIRKTPGTPIWQRDYYEHIIRNENALHNIRRYIASNPASWKG
jgi:putative transposase